MINLKHFLRLGSKESYQDSSESEVKFAGFAENAEVTEDTAIMVELDNKISFLSDFLTNQFL